jgi:hypothetical protein
MSNKWKDNILRSSFPIEQHVAEELEKKKFYVYGEYSYARTNELGIETEFSIDVRAVEFLCRKDKRNWANIEAYVECKYDSPECRWLFLEYPEKTEVDRPVMLVVDDFSPAHIKNKLPLYRFGDEFSYCTKGIRLTGNDIDNKTIKRGLSQLQYAMPNVVEACWSWQLMANAGEDAAIDFVVGILVTNAPLLILNKGVTIEDIRNSGNISEITRAVNWLAVSQQSHESLRSYANSIGNKFFENHSDLHDRHLQLKELRQDKYDLPVDSTIWWGLHDSYINTLVVNLSSFHELISKICGVVRKLGKFERRFADIEVIKDPLRRRFVPLKPQQGGSPDR